jgi:uncharacterized membrane protein
MHLTVDRYPVTIMFCIIWSVVAFVFVVFDINNPLRIILSIPIIIFIPGFLLVSILFPAKTTEKGIDTIERIALSLGISIAIVPLMGMALNYSPWGIELQPIILSLEAFILIMGSIAIIRWYRTPPSNRNTLHISISFPHHETKLDKLLTTILVICIIIAVSALIYVILVPKQGEQFTEFYILGPDHLAHNYPMNLTVGENATVILGIVNQENTPRNYSVEVWLSNQTTRYNSTSNMNETIYYHLYFMDKLNVTLNPTPINLEGIWTPQWEHNYSFHINRKGSYKFVFLLYINETQNYIKYEDYKTLAIEKVDENQTTAYRSIYLWINVK